MNLYHALFARVLVDIDFSQPQLERILANLRDEENSLDIGFFVVISYERLPKFCVECSAFTHNTEDCRRDFPVWNFQELNSRARAEDNNTLWRTKSDGLNGKGANRIADPEQGVFQSSKYVQQRPGDPGARMASSNPHTGQFGDNGIPLA